MPSAAAQAPVPCDGPHRLVRLRRFGQPSTSAEPGLDRLARLCGRLFSAPMVVITTASGERVWAAPASDTPVELPSHVLPPLFGCDAPGAFVIADARRDERLARHPTVAGPLAMRFVATAPLRTPEGTPLGTLSILDRHPRRLDPGAVATLEDLAAMAVAELMLQQAHRDADRAEAAHEAHAAFVEHAIEILDDLFFAIDAAGRLERWNNRLNQVTGYSDAELARMHLGDFVRPEDLPRVKQALLTGFRSGHARVEAALVTRDGRSIPYLFSGSAVRNRHGRAIGLCGTGHDLSSSLAAKEALRVTEHRYRDLFERANVPVLVIDPEDEIILEANPEACRTYGFEHDDLIGRSLKTLTVDVQRGEQEIRHILTHGGDRSFESKHYRRDGSTFHMLLNCSTFDFDGRPAVLCFGQDISTRKQYEDELIVAKVRAEEMARLKDAMLSNMSHEIRTPLTGIIGFADVLAEEVTGEPLEFVQLIRKCGQRLMETLNSVLDLAQLESGSFEVTLRPTDVMALAWETVDLLSPLAQERGLELHFTPPDEPAWALLDPAAFNRILTNLLSNALKFTRQGCVTLAVTTTAGHVILHVRDTGVGISPEFLPHLFDAFRQESGGLARHYEGNGLGLAIVKRLVEILGGTISVESVKHHGTTFTARFPRLSPPHLPAAVPVHRAAPIPGATPSLLDTSDT